MYCPRGEAAAPLSVGPGYYTLPEDSSLVTFRSSAHPCPPGFYCSGGVRLPCPVGRYGSASALSLPACSGPCKGGYFCPLGSLSPTERACGSAGSEAYCPEGGAQLPVQGSWSEERVAREGQLLAASPRLDGQQVGVEVVRSGAGLVACPAGFWCLPSGVAQPCPAGRAGTLPGGTHPSHCDSACEGGFYCSEGSSSPRAVPCGGAALFCPPGSPRPLPVGPGNYSFGGNLNSALPSELTRSGQAPCPLGHWCQKGLARACPAGHWGQTQGLASSQCSGKCPAGFTCPPGSTTPFGSGPCTDAATFCPAGSGAEPTPLTPGYHSVFNTTSYAPAPTISSSSLTVSVSTTQVLCSPGFWCGGGGTATPCAAGRWGGAPGLQSAECSGLCEEGYFCPAASTTPRAAACGSLAVYCPKGSGAPSPVPAGHLSLPARSTVEDLLPTKPPLHGSPTAAAAPPFPSACPAAWAQGAEAAHLFDLQATLARESPALVGRGLTALNAHAHAVNGTTRASIAACPPGSFCLRGLASPCPPGRFSSAPGAAGAQGSPPTCPGICAEGFFCPQGSSSAHQRPCGNASVFCPRGAGEPRAVPPGAYSGGGVGGGGGPGAPPPPSGASLLPELLCGGDSEDSPALHTLPPPLAAQHLLAHPFFTSAAAAARAGAGLPYGVWPELQRAPCLSSSSALLPPPGSGAACQGYILGGARTRAWAAQCPMGHYCSNGEVFACPAGRFGASSGLSSLALCGQCEAGYFCPLASNSSRAFPCGAARVFCPAGSGAPQPVTPGYFTQPAGHPSTPAQAAAESGALRGSQAPCPPGYYCTTSGLPSPCPAGRYGSVQGEENPQCTDVCAPGFFCPPGSTSAHPRPCGSSAVFCPPGSTSPRPVPLGYYSTGTSPAFPALAAANATRSSVVACGAGWWCRGGVAFECPPGRYGASPMQSSPECSGVCAHGHFCPPGSTHATPYRCGDVYAVLVDVLSSLPAQAALLAGSGGGLDTDAFPLAPPGYSPRALAALYSSLLATSTTTSAPPGAPGGPAPFGVAASGSSDVPWGEWRLNSGVDALGGGLGFGEPLEVALSAVWKAAGGRGTPGASQAASLLVTFAERAAQVTALIPLGAFIASPGLRALLAAANTSSGGSGSWGVGGWGSGPGRYTLKVLGGGAAAVNFTASIRWHGGQRLKLPSLTLPVDSFAAVHRALVVGGPSAVYCPQGSGWPSPAASGYYTNTSTAAVAAVLGAAEATLAAMQSLAGVGGPASNPLQEALAAVQANTTADGALPAPPGFYAVAGRLEPCPAGLFSALPAASGLEACLPCPAGYACPLGTGSPAGCADGWYATAGAAECTQCPPPHDSDFISPGLVAPIDPSEAQRQWPLGSNAEPGALGLPAAPTMVRCKSSVRCCE